MMTIKTDVQDQYILTSRKPALKVRLASKTLDADFFREQFFNNFEDRRKLNFNGAISEEFIENGYWNLTYVATVDGKTAGFIYFKADHSISSINIADIYVAPNYRRRGIAYLLLEAAEQFARSSWDLRQFHALTIENDSMEALLKFAGYKLSGTYKQMYRKNGKWYSQSRWIKPV
jgi:GNAT superfamily N-acetyltransferase